MLIITGVGRCGTSVIAKFFHNMGFNLGKVEWNDDINAGMEDAGVVWINRSLYVCTLKHGSPSRFLLKGRRHILNCNLKIVKDPRFTWPGVLEGWCKFRKDLKILILYRDFNAVLASRKKMGGESNDMIDPRKYTMERLQTDFARFFNVILTNKIKYRILLFPDIVRNQANIMYALGDLGIELSFTKGLQVLERIIDRSLVSEFNGKK